MKKGESGYALQKLSLGIDILTVHPEDIKHRLRAAYFKEWIHIMREDIPECLLYLWDDILSGLIRKGPRIDSNGKAFVSDIDNSLHGMHKKTAFKIAEKVLELHGRFNGYMIDLQNQNKPNKALHPTAFTPGEAPVMIPACAGTGCG
jgi:hypothetical protein